jgi:hypothetical protein
VVHLISLTGKTVFSRPSKFRSANTPVQWQQFPHGEKKQGIKLTMELPLVVMLMSGVLLPHPKDWTGLITFFTCLNVEVIKCQMVG